MEPPRFDKSDMTIQRMPAGSQGLPPLPYEALKTERFKRTLRKVQPCISPEKKTLVLDNFYKRGMRMRKIGRILGIRYTVVEDILREIYLEVTPPPAKSMRMAA